jgi:hypothetical protein
VHITVELVRHLQKKLKFQNSQKLQKFQKFQKIQNFEQIPGGNSDTLSNFY